MAIASRGLAGSKGGATTVAAQQGSPKADDGDDGNVADTDAAANCCIGCMTFC